jgi:hypothetical protein
MNTRRDTKIFAPAQNVGVAINPGPAGRRRMGMEEYVAITHRQNPLTGNAEPIVLRLKPETTVGAIAQWYRSVHQDLRATYPLGDVQIVQVDN